MGIRTDSPIVARVTLTMVRREDWMHDSRQLALGVHLELDAPHGHLQSCIASGQGTPEQQLLLSQEWCSEPSEH